ncbi:hypothetical protein MTO96_003142 [Rhipicephalus appendiculatus]
MLDTIWEDELEDATSTRESDSTDDDEDDFTLCVRTSTHDDTSLDFSFTLPRTSHGEAHASLSSLDPPVTVPQLCDSTYELSEVV